MKPSCFPLPTRVRLTLAAIVLLFLLAIAPVALAADAYVRVKQIGYEANGSRRAYLMSTMAETGATFKMINLKGATSFRGKIGTLLGTWSHSKTVMCYAYALDFSVPAADIYTIKVSGAVAATSSPFAVDSPDVL